MAEFDYLIVSCEHGGNRLPPKWRPRFEEHRELLESYRGYDKGALELAREIANEFRAPLHSSITTRLLVDLNRSLSNRDIFSPISSRFSEEEKEEVIQKFYQPYRRAIEAEIAEWIARNRRVLHLSVHTFTPVLMNGETRNADIGLLYDPSRKIETAFCVELQDRIESASRGIVVRRNYPYSGTDDGITRHLRALFPAMLYTGIELEVNHRLYLEAAQEWRDRKDVIVDSLAQVLSIKRPK